MKRSEMVELLAVQFMKYCNGGTTPQKVGNYLLRCCEENGMLPPIRDRIGDEQEMCDAINYAKYINAWSPEDVS